MTKYLRKISTPSKVGSTKVIDSLNSTSKTDALSADAGRELNEKIKNITSLKNYSTEETIIGTWIDGKPLYRKMVDFGTLPNNSEASKSHNIANIKHIHINLGETFWCHNSTPYEESTGNSFSLTYTNYIRLFEVNKTNLIIQTVANGTNYHMLVCLEYTKTTD